MPKTDEHGNPDRDEIPDPLRRSDAKAQETFAKAYDAAAEQYDDESRVARTAWAALKQTHEKVGDRWEPKEESGPSDSRSETSGRDTGETAGGVDANASKEHLYEQAQRLDIPGRSDMTKDELVDALEDASRRRNREARDKGE